MATDLPTFFMLNQLLNSLQTETFAKKLNGTLLELDKAEQRKKQVINLNKNSASRSLNTALPTSALTLKISTLSFCMYHANSYLFTAD
jgi:hypothetical protein